MKIKDYKGITLIAMIITIIVMLVLAGVSMNAIVGDNGILSNAINATIATSIAVLQEYLQELYVENYDDATVATATNKVEALSKLSAYTNYFYDPSRDGDNDGEVTYGAVSYVVDSEGYALYLIKKSGLPEDIQKQLVGGDAGDGNYADYLNLNDVYGVTSSLEVYYCSSGLSSITGVASSELDDDDINRTVSISDSGLKNLLSSYAESDGTIKASSLRSVKTLTIDSSVSSLKDLYNLTSLQELTISSATLSNLNGIENCSQLYYVYFKSSTIADYSSLAKLGAKLKHLYFYNINDDELTTACEGITNAEFSNLTYFAIVGNTYGISYFTDFSYYSSSKSTNTITTLYPLSTLSSTTKSAVKYFSINNNNITGDLSYISDYINLYSLRCEYNNITTLNGLSCSSTLVYLCGGNNQLGATSYKDDKGTTSTIAEDASSGTAISALVNNTSLHYVYLINNSYLANVGYFVNDTAIEYLYLAGCSTTMIVNGITTIIANCGANYSLPVTLLTASVYDASNYYTISSSTTLTTDSDLYKSLKSDLYQNTYITHLNLENVVFETDDMYQDILETMINLQYVTLKGCNGLQSIDFVHEQITVDNVITGVTGLIELDLRNTGSSLTDLTGLNSYATSLKTLLINDSNLDNEQYIDLSTIISVLNHLTTGSYWTSSYGLYCGSVNSLASLSGSTGLTYLHVTVPTNMDASSVVLDLTTNQSLTQIQFNYLPCKCYVPASLTYFRSDGGYPPIISTDTGTISNLWALFKSDVDENYLIEYFTSLTNATEITTIRVDETNVLDSLSYFAYCSNANIIQINVYASTSVSTTLDGISNISASLKSFSLNSGYSVDLSDLGNCFNLTTVSMIGCNIRDGAVLSSLSKLETLLLADNQISDLKFLDTLLNLEKLNLTNNCIYDTSTYTDDDGNTVSYKNLQILADLYNNGALRKLYLSGNSGITDYSLISGLSWTAKDF